MILDTDKEPLEEKDFEQEETPKVLTEREAKAIIERQLKEIGYEIDPELADIVNKEGDFEEWIDPLSNYTCRIVRMIQFQHWNGYVRIPDTHPCFGKGYDDISVEVHGGLTYSDDHFPNYTSVIKDGYWILGFDTGHAWDRSPRILIHFPNHHRFEREVYRTKEYVTKEVTKLAKQLKDMEGC